MARPRQLPPLVQEALPAIEAYARSSSKVFRQPAEDLLQVALEVAIRLEPGFDAAYGATFLTYIWRAMMGAVIRYAEKNLSEEEGREWDATIDAAADHVECVSAPVNVMYESDEQLVERAGDMRRGMTTAMALAYAREEWGPVGGSGAAGRGGVRGRGENPEAALVRAREKRWLRVALEGAIATLKESDREIVRRHGLGGEELKAVLQEIPEWRARDYKAGWKHYGRLLKRIGEEMWRGRGVDWEDALGVEGE